ncbi:MULTISPECIES: hypothetical protein [unclassified Roseovarius]|uniref:hypothetical protein n=1 Tax=unclassified Roseovarius TaxID=2614913 RepID=UPI00273E9889|nr:MULTISPECIES: hypothetical protein [unclassified Roseovarius]
MQDFIYDTTITTLVTDHIDHSEHVRNRLEASITELITFKKATKMPIEGYLAMGEYLHYLAIDVPSTKLRHKKILEDFPGFRRFDKPVRSNAKRLWEALEGYRDEDILTVLGVADISDYYTSNPTVIIRDYRNKKRPA